VPPAGFGQGRDRAGHARVGVLPGPAELGGEIVRAERQHVYPVDRRDLVRVRHAGRVSMRIAATVAGVDTIRHSVLIVRDGEHLSPRMAATIAAVRSVSAELRAGSG